MAHTQSGHPGFPRRGLASFGPSGRHSTDVLSLLLALLLFFQSDTLLLSIIISIFFSIRSSFILARPVQAVVRRLSHCDRFIDLSITSLFSLINKEPLYQTPLRTVIAVPCHLLCFEPRRFGPTVLGTRLKDFMVRLKRIQNSAAS